jgi:pilus assembly protein Flp/PilA
MALIFVFREARTDLSMARVSFFSYLWGCRYARRGYRAPNVLKTQGHSSERGQGLAEYAFILVLVAVVVIVVLALFGDSVEALYNSAIPTLVNAFSGNATP